MAAGRKSNARQSNYLMVLLLMTVLITTLLIIPADAGSFSEPRTTQIPSSNQKTQFQGRRMLIGSTAPNCTYNECRGCRFRCRAEQIPVDGNDPINSAYRYKCVCHR